MKAPTIARAATLLLAGLLAGLPVVGLAQGDGDGLRMAKALFFDRKYVEARKAWQAILGSATGAQADQAAYWVARCSENLGENERAMKEYGDFLGRKPQDKTLLDEAKTSRVALAARLYKAGQRQHLPVLETALTDGSKTVRLYAALQLAGLGAPVGSKAVPTLLTIIETERDEDLVERAKLALLKADPQALARLTKKGQSAPSVSGKWVRVKIYERGKKDPSVSLNVPMVLAEMLYKSLPEDAREDLRREGYDAESFWERLRRLPPTEILTIEGDDGERIQIWIE